MAGGMRHGRKVVWTLAHRSGLAALSRSLRRSELVVLCYHGVCAERLSSDWLLHPVESFEREIDYVARHYEILQADEALRRLYGPGLSRPTAVITFDDGYANNLTVALPVLKRHQAPATVYLTTGLIESGGYLWTTVLQHALRQTELDILEVGDPRVDGPLGASERERVRRAVEIKDSLKLLRADERKALSAEIVEQAGRPHGLEAFRLMTPAEVAELDRQGLVTFGAHTRTHPILSMLGGRELEEEVCGSVEDVSRLKHVSKTFAYPNGRPQDYDERTIHLLRAVGVEAGMSTRQWLQRRTFDRFHVRRVVVDGGMAFSDFVSALSGVKETLSSIRRGGAVQLDVADALLAQEGGLAR
jgi:peptidoglycan/xylan/chitin deacetylase (PgdA/CDA1 family)